MWNIKSSNRILDLKQKQEAHMRHLRALQNIKPSISIKEPQRYNFLQYKAKNLQKAKQRNQEIQYHNSMLVNRMITMPSSLENSTGVYFKESLNSAVMRRRESLIDQQNQKIVRRLQSANSKYSQKAMSKSVKSYYKAKTNMASSKMDQFYDFQSHGHKKSLELFQPNRHEPTRSRPFSAKR